MHGLGNDFLIFSWSEQLPQRNLIKAISSRSKGVGCDLVVFLVKLEKNIANYKTHFFNNDGTRAEICGNALRCIGKLHYEKFGKPLFSSHMLDLSAEEIDFNLSECERLLKRMSKIGLSLEIELGVTGGEEDGVVSDDDIGADNPLLYTQPEDCLRAY